MRDPKAPTARRDAAALAAAPYCHPKAGQIRTKPVEGVAIPADERWQPRLRPHPPVYKKAEDDPDEN
jgi:hypothetical protein